MFIPINNIRFVREDTTSKGWIESSIDSRYANGKALKNLPQGYKRTHEDDKKHYYIRKENGRFSWDIHVDKAERFASLSAYHKKVRKELVRYNPQKFEKYMESKQNWLLHEFIEKALYQFVDEISCEITHHSFFTAHTKKFYNIYFTEMEVLIKRCEISADKRFYLLS